MGKKNERLVASLVLHGVAGMTWRERLALRSWLGEQVLGIYRDGCNYSKLFTARYYVPVGDRRGKKNV